MAAHIRFFISRARSSLTPLPHYDNSSSDLDEAKRWFEAAAVVCRSVPDGARHSERVRGFYSRKGFDGVTGFMISLSLFRYRRHIIVSWISMLHERHNSHRGSARVGLQTSRLMLLCCPRVSGQLHFSPRVTPLLACSALCLYPCLRFRERPRELLVCPTYFCSTGITCMREHSYWAFLQFAPSAPLF